MKRTLCITAALATAMLVGCSHPQPVYAPPPPVIDFQGIQQQAYRDGFDAGRRDVETGQPPVFNRHPRWRNPPVPRPAWQAYRNGFHNGYTSFLHHDAPPPA